MSELNPYAVERIVLQAREQRGERLPVLLWKSNRTPVTRPMEWVLAKRRQQVAANTIDRELRATGVFEWWLAREGLSLDDPFAFVDDFTPNRIESSLGPWLSRDFSGRKLRKFSVSSAYKVQRILAIEGYIDWVLTNALRSISIRTHPERIRAFAIVKDSIAQALQDLKPTQNDAGRPEGLTKASRTRLLEVIEPEHPQNPWGHGPSKFVMALRRRNRLIVLLLLAHGMRRGDLLKVVTADVKTHSAEPVLCVVRRPDDPNDTRVIEPGSKTEERILPLDPSLTRLLNDYIRVDRRKIRNSKKTPYLVLSLTTGQPLSLRALNDVFDPLKAHFPGIHPHTCRYTHNDALLEHSRRAGLSAKEATDHAKYLNGWLGDNVHTYTRRERREAAQKISKAVQQELFAPVEDIPF